jgi:hypothetical protein
MRLVRSGARTDSASASDAIAPEDSDDAVDRAVVVALPATTGLADATRLRGDPTAETARGILPFDPGVLNLEAAVELVCAGLAARIVLSGFPSLPGLLWRAYQMAETSGVRIIPTAVRPGGRVDIVITRDIAPIG